MKISFIIAYNTNKIFPFSTQYSLGGILPSVLFSVGRKRPNYSMLVGNLLQEKYLVLKHPKNKKYK
jgi:hypothetical protein